MRAKASRDEQGDVRGLLAELGDLVEDLGLEEVVEHRPPPPATTDATAQHAETTAPPAAETAVVQPDSNDMAELAELAAALVPLWEPAAPAPPTTLWDAFAPELDAAPPRPWTPGAAMEVVEPAGPPRSAESERQPRRLHVFTGALRSRLFTAVTVAAVLIAIAVVVLTRVDFGSTTGPDHPVARAAFEVTRMRTVDATSAAVVAQAPTRSHFPARVTDVFMDVVYRNAGSGDAIRLVISLLPPAGSGGNPVTVGDQNHVLPSGGEIAVTIQGPATGFASGDYTVTAFHDGHLEQSLAFTVDAPVPSPTP
ncbi:MAG TPA: hypothetical protein VN193_12480 [Candidatus Angelobacter sp.]|jgi:hypothetical protein|nr:hypothetical protein [Candidatus Angelobacter sp.]